MSKNPLLQDSQTSTPQASPREFPLDFKPELDKPEAKSEYNLKIPPEQLKLDPSEEISLEDLAKIDFSHKPEKVQKLDKAVSEAAAARQFDPNNPFKGLYCLTYKGEGPMEFVLFRSDRPQALIARDCKVWCQAKNVRYIKYKQIFVNILTPGNEVQDGPPAGDVTALITKGWAHSTTEQ